MGEKDLDIRPLTQEVSPICTSLFFHCEGYIPGCLLSIEKLKTAAVCVRVLFTTYVDVIHLQNN